MPRLLLSLMLILQRLPARPSAMTGSPGPTTDRLALQENFFATLAAISPSKTIPI